MPDQTVPTWRVSREIPLSWLASLIIAALLAGVGQSAMIVRWAWQVDQSFADHERRLLSLEEGARALSGRIESESGRINARVESADAARRSEMEKMSDEIGERTDRRDAQAQAVSERLAGVEAELRSIRVLLERVISGRSGRSGTMGPGLRRPAAFRPP